MRESVYNVEAEDRPTYLAGNIQGAVASGVPQATDPAKPGKELVRFGQSPETVEKLASDAAAALANPQLRIHGVSAFYRKPVPSAAEFASVAAAFKIYKTLGRGHYTIELPSPVTQEIADTFNRVFGRIP